MNHLACQLREIKLASGEGAEAMTFEGYGAVFGNVDSYGDVIERGAFTAYLEDVKNGKQNWPAMLSQHGGWGMSSDDMTPIGIWTELSEDRTGLKVKGRLADTERGRELYTLMKMERPAIDGLSIGYLAKEFEMGTKPSEPRRKLKRIDLMEISPVTFPANGKARVRSVKSLEEMETLSEIETFLREAGGFSRNEAKALIARIKSASPREAEDDMKQISAALTGILNTMKGKMS